MHQGTRGRVSDARCEASRADSHLAEGAIKDPSYLRGPHPVKGGQTRKSTADHEHRNVTRMEVIAQPAHIGAHSRRDNIEQESEKDDILVSLRQPESGCNANVRQEQVRKRPSRTGSPEIERVKDGKPRKECLR